MKLYWGHEEFRPNQEKICLHLLQKKSALILMPTGAGKSLCYQLPSLLLKGVCLVISPLLALMEESSLNLRKLGLQAECIHSGQDQSKNQKTLEDYKYSKLDFLFIAPERLTQKEFIYKRTSSNFS